MSTTTADLTTVQKMVTEILNASASGTFSATLDTNNKDRVAAAIDESIRYSAYLIAKAVVGNPTHPHRSLYRSKVPYGITNGELVPDSAGQFDTIEIRKHADNAYAPGVPRTVQEVMAYRENRLGIYTATGHNFQYNPLAGYYAISNNRVYWTGLSARIWKPVINRKFTIGTAGVKQVETITFGAACSTDGSATVVVTADGMPNSPISFTVPLLVINDFTAELVANTILTYIDTNTDLDSWFTMTQSTNDLIFTCKQELEEDTTMSIAVTNAGGTGIGTPSSTTTTAGVAPCVTTLIPAEYEPAWVALAVGNFTLKEGDNLYPIVQHYLNVGMMDLQSIAENSGFLNSTNVLARAMEARGDVV